MNCEGKSIGVMNTKKLLPKSNTGRPIMFDFHKKTFPFQSHLNKYFKNHNTENSGKKCFLKPFFYSKGLSKNLKIHFLYECTFCQKLFAHNSNLSRHMRVHSDEKLFQCNLCEKSFTSSSNLGTHLGNHSGSHMIKNPFKCGYCKKIFTKSNELIKHIELHTKQNFDQQKSSCSLKTVPSSEGGRSCSGTKHVDEQPVSPRGDCSFDQQYKPDHTYCFSASQELNDGNETNSHASGNKSKCHSKSMEKNQSQPDHTYWSHAKKSRLCKRKVKSSRSSQKPSVNQPDSNQPNIESDHTYSSGCSTNMLGSKLQSEPSPCSSELVPEKNARKLKPDHTYSIGVHRSEKKTNAQEDSSLQLVHHSSHTDNCSNSGRPIPLNTQHNQNSQPMSIPLKKSSKNNCLDQPVETTVHCSNISKPDHTYSHKKGIISNMNNLKTFGNRLAKSDWEKLSFTLQAAKENQPSFDHTYCSDAKLQKETEGKGTDHTYCLEENDFICSHNWNANMMSDHTYCSMHAVTRHF